MSNRKYSVTSTMLAELYGPTTQVIEPDANLVKQFHAYLDLIPDDNLALVIDLVVSNLIKFHNPNRQHYPEIMHQPPQSEEA